jgi:hypothetical protein
LRIAERRRLRVTRPTGSDPPEATRFPDRSTLRVDGEAAFPLIPAASECASTTPSG